MPMPGRPRQAVVLDANSTFSRSDQALKSYGDDIKHKTEFKVGIFPTLFYNIRSIFAYMYVLPSAVKP